MFNDIMYSPRIFFKDIMSQMTDDDIEKVMPTEQDETKSYMRQRLIDFYWFWEIGDVISEPFLARLGFRWNRAVGKYLSIFKDLIADGNIVTENRTLTIKNSGVDILEKEKGTTNAHTGTDSFTQDDTSTDYSRASQNAKSDYDGNHTNTYDSKYVNSGSDTDTTTHGKTVTTTDKKVNYQETDFAYSFVEQFVGEFYTLFMEVC